MADQLPTRDEISMAIRALMDCAKDPRGSHVEGLGYVILRDVDALYSAIGRFRSAWTRYTQDGNNVVLYSEIAALVRKERTLSEYAQDVGARDNAEVAPQGRDAGRRTDGPAEPTANSNASSGFKSGLAAPPSSSAGPASPPPRGRE